MNVKSFFKKFAAVAVQVAPIAMIAVGAPPQLGTIIASSITSAQAMVGASNAEKAARAAEIAQHSIEAVNAIAVQHGGHAIIDESVTSDVLANAIKITYDMTKIAHTANGDPMPQLTAG